MLEMEVDSFGPVRMPDGGERNLVKIYLKDGYRRICEVEDKDFLAPLAISIDLLEISRKILALGIAGPYTEELEKTVQKAGDFNRSETEQTKGTSP